MRISEDRYFRDLRPLLLAARMLKLEARTRTICTWTGMSRDRIRKLAGSTAFSSGQDRRVRHRGRSPRQTAYFFRSPRIYTHANVLACYFAMVDLVPHAPDVIPARTFPSVPRGELLCEIYGSLYSPCPDVLIDFERAILLATALAERDEVALEHCGDCGGLMLIAVAGRGSAIEVHATIDRGGSDSRALPPIPCQACGQLMPVRCRGYFLFRRSPLRMGYRVAAAHALPRTLEKTRRQSLCQSNIMTQRELNTSYSAGMERQKHLNSASQTVTPLSDTVCAFLHKHGGKLGSRNTLICLGC